MYIYSSVFWKRERECVCVRVRVGNSLTSPLSHKYSIRCDVHYFTVSPICCSYRHRIFLKEKKIRLPHTQQYNIYTYKYTFERIYQRTFARNPLNTFASLTCGRALFVWSSFLFHKHTISAFVGITMCANQCARWTPSNGTFLYFFLFAFCFSSISHLCYAKVCVCFLKTGAYIWNRHSNELCMECREREFIEGREAKKKRVREPKPILSFNRSHIIFSLFCCLFFLYFILYHRVPDLRI